MGVLGAGVIALGDLGRQQVGLRTWIEVALTLTMATALWWRRRHPLALALGGAAAVVAGASSMVLLVTLLTVAVRRRDRWLAVAALASFAAYAVTIWRAGPVDLVPSLLSGVGFIGLPVAFGAFVGTRRDLLNSLRERAEQAELEQEVRAAQARLAERGRIAQEMHDVLAHRISLVALHAGGLEVNPGTAPDEVERAAALIRITARQALQELRDVLGVLRTDDPGARPQRQPQPTLAELGGLVQASADAGVDVELHREVPPGASVPILPGRTAYRVVQEALTNIHKHAPGASARVVVSGAPGDRLEVEVTNGPPATIGAPSAIGGGSGLGLVGLRERVTLSQGLFEAGTRPDGGYRLHARLPWPTEADDTAAAGGRS